jgi:hypothetical protein
MHFLPRVGLIEIIAPVEALGCPPSNVGGLDRDRPDSLTCRAGLQIAIKRYKISARGNASALKLSYRAEPEGGLQRAPFGSDFGGPIGMGAPVESSLRVEDSPAVPSW